MQLLSTIAGSGTPSGWWWATAVALPVLLSCMACGGGSPQADYSEDLPATPPVGPPSPPTTPPGSKGILIRPGESIQAAVDAHPPGTTFVITAGVHRRQMILPKSRDVFQGEPGAILDGEGVTPHAFEGSNGAARVKIRGLLIENYAPSYRDAAIMASDANRWTTQGWVIENCEIRYSITPDGGGMAIRIGDGTVVRGNHLHHNDQYGIGGSGAGVLIVGNEIAYNNYRQLSSVGQGAGGTKLVGTSGLVFRDNFVHHNWGNGIWTDIENRDVLIEGNRVEDNAGQGIFHEIGYAIRIRDNVVRRNGHDLGRWAYGAGILISNSAGAEVSGNLVEDNFNGILGIQQDRGPYVLDSLWVHDNTVVQAIGWAGGVASGEDSLNKTVFNRSLRFEDNTYVLSSNAAYFVWLNVPRTALEWRLFGLDVNGTFTILDQGKAPTAPKAARRAMPRASQRLPR